MTNPINKKTKEQFVLEIPKELDITIIGEYINTDTKIEYICKHGTHFARPWQILGYRHCCREGYYESGVMWKNNTNTLEEVREKALKDRNTIDVSETYFEVDRYKKLRNIRCILHNVYYDSIATSTKIGLCPKCNKERNIKQLKDCAHIGYARCFVSKQETKWLDRLGIKERQVWLEDIKYKVDGYDPLTKTVYLYHGSFWHGDPKKFDAEMIHPVVKISMGDLYERTMHYENKIRNAGYNLIVEWENDERRRY